MVAVEQEAAEGQQAPQGPASLRAPTQVEPEENYGCSR